MVQSGTIRLPRKVLAGALLLAAHAGSLAQAPVAAEAPATNIGDSYTYQGSLLRLDCQRWEVVRFEAGNTSVSQCKDKPMYLYRDAASHNIIRATTQTGDTLIEFKPLFQHLSFPLFVGKKWQTRYSGRLADIFRRWDGNLECEAKAFETVHITAGSFAAFRIECTDQRTLGYIFRDTSRTTRWYAPALGTVVKYLADDSSWNYELTAFKSANSSTIR